MKGIGSRDKGYPRGTPKRCELPMTMSAPMSPGGVSIVSESRSATKIDITCEFVGRSMRRMQAVTLDAWRKGHLGPVS